MCKGNGAPAPEHRSRETEMLARSRLLRALAVAGVVVAFALAPIQAFAARSVSAVSGHVSGVVVSLESRILPDTGAIVTDVGILQGPTLGTAVSTEFTMQGGVVGDLGMWSEQYAELHLGDYVLADVAVVGGSSNAVAAPEELAQLPGLLPDISPGVAGVSAGYIWGGLHWPDSSLPVKYYVNATGLPAGGESAIVAAAQTWEDDARSYMDLTYMGTTSVLPSAGHDGYNVVGVGDLSDSGTIAQCQYFYSPTTYHIIAFDIVYNTAHFTFATDGNANAYDVQGIGTHELGHMLSLGDMYESENANQVMYGYAYRGDTTNRVLAWGDIAGIRAIYPVTDNDPPAAVADSATMPEDQILTVPAPGVLGNDSDPDGDTLTANCVINVHHGSLTLSPNGAYTYRPAANYNGEDFFTYRAYDGAAYSNTVTVTITVQGVNDAPVAVADARTTPEDTALVVSAPGVLSNDTDPEGDPLTANLVANVSHGTLSLASNGSFTYTPAADYNGPDSFTYRARDGAAYSNTVAVSITVTPVNDAPVAVADAHSAGSGRTLVVAAPGVLSNDTDVEGDALTASLFSNVSHGQLQLSPDGGYTYTPSGSFEGTDTFTYRAYDGVAYSNTVTVTLTVVAGLDEAAPETMTDAVTDYVNSATIVLTASDDEQGSGVAHTYYSLNGGGQVEGTTVAVPGPGTYSLEYWSVDAENNVEGHHTVSFTVVTPPPSNGSPSLPAPIPTLMHRTAFTVDGYVILHAAGSKPVTLQFYQKKSGKWRLKKSVTAAVSTFLTFSRFSKATSVTSAGKWRVRARHKVGKKYRYSNWQYFTAS
jgi:VCBS repeat-containing protein